MTSDDIIYVLLLVISVPLGYLVKQSSSYTQKQYLSTVFGVIIALIVCGRTIIHSLITVFVNNTLLLLIPKRWAGGVSFAWCFGYLLFFRLAHLTGLPASSPYSNALQLLLTLRLVGLAFELSDARRSRDESKSQAASGDSRTPAPNDISPSFCDMCHYSYCFIGQLTGPYYKYSVYEDMLTSKTSSAIAVWPALKRQLRVLPVFVAGFVLVSRYFSLAEVQSEEFYAQSFTYRLFYMFPMFFIFRMRFYIAWTLAEAVCISSTLGTYPTSCRARPGQGPTDLVAWQQWREERRDVDKVKAVQCDNETTHNIDAYGCDFAWRVGEGMRSWNMTVQYWMAHHVYKRLPLRNTTARVAVTMAASAYWHGLHPGYYLSMLTVAPNMAAESVMIQAFHKDRSPWQQRVFRGFSWFWRMRSFDYMSMGFMLLSLEATLRYWSSVYFIGHVIIAFCFLIGSFSQLVFKPAKIAAKVQ